jgi:hypothetical protein
MRAAARGEAEETVGAAVVRAREFSRNAEAVWRERRRLIDDMQAVAEQLVGISETEAERFAHFVRVLEDEHAVEPESDK